MPRFAQLAAALTSAGVDVVITAGRSEGELARDVASRAGLPREAVVGGEVDIPFADLVELVGRAGALVSGDTGLAHLAVGLATPSVTLFGPMSPALWGPPNHARHAALWHADPAEGLRPGDPAGSTVDERLLRISVSEVLQALDAVMSERHAGHAASGGTTTA